MLRNPRALLYAALLLALLNLVHRADPPQQLPIVKADMPYCFTVKNPPLEQREPKVPFSRRKDVA